MKRVILSSLVLLIFLGNCSKSPNNPRIKQSPVKIISSEMTVFLNAELTSRGILDTFERLFDTVKFDSMMQNDTLTYAVSVNPSYYEYYSNSSDSALVQYYGSSDMEIIVHSDYDQNTISIISGVVSSKCEAGVFGYQANIILRGNESYGDNSTKFNFIISPENSYCLLSFRASFLGNGTNSFGKFKLSRVISENDFTVDSVLINSSFPLNNIVSYELDSGQVYLIDLSTFSNADWLSGGSFHTSASLTLDFEIEFTSQ